MSNKLLLFAVINLKSYFLKQPIISEDNALIIAKKENKVKYVM